MKKNIMQTLIKKLLLFISLLFLLSGCFLTDNNFDLGQKNHTDTVKILSHSTQIVSYYDTVTNVELDSIIEAEMLPEVKTWAVCEFFDYETGATITKSTYYKQNKDGSACYYVITGQTEPYIIEKREEK